MQKAFSSTLHLLAVATMLAGSAFSQTQQTPPAKQSTTPAKSATAAKPAAKVPAKAGAAAPPLTTDKAKFSYAFGVNFWQGMGPKFKEGNIDFDPALFAQGIKDAMAGKNIRLTEDQIKTIMTDAQNKAMKAMQEKAKQEADENKAAGDAFLAANKGKEGVVTLPDGLQYKILTTGTGPKPTANDTVEANYKGTFVDGTEFDGSAKHGGPVSFRVGGVIKGWTEALEMMPVGSKWQLFIPPSLAYGEQGRQGGMPPNETLVFEVELVSIKPAEAPKAPDAAPPASQPATPPDAAQPKSPDRK